jgi:hypothetical protein
MRQIITVLLFVAFSSSFAQTHEIKTSHFKDISIFGPFKVTLVKATTSKAEIDYRGIDPDDVITDCSGDELEIKIRSKGFFDFGDDWDRSKNRKYALVTIYYTTLEEIEIKAGASLRATETIQAQRLKLRSRMGAEMELSLDVKELSLESSMGSEVDLSGKAEDFELKAKMGTDVDASQLKCQNVTVSASMGADVKVFAEKELNASANFGASISIKGNPAHKNTSGSFGADVD